MKIPDDTLDIASVIHRRLEQLGLGQRDLAIGAEVTESYISQLLAKKKPPPASRRTDIYDRIARVLRIPSRDLAKLAEVQRREELKRKVLDLPQPLFQEFRQLILRKCFPAKKKQVRSIFEREPFGEFERFVTQKLLDVAKRVAKEELEDKRWIQRLANIGNRRYQATQVSVLELLDTDIFHVSLQNCVSILEPLLEKWDIEFDSFAMTIVLSRKLSRRRSIRLAFQEVDEMPQPEIEPGFRRFLRDPKLSGGISSEESACLQRLRISGRRPSALYYYRELQNLRDPLNFLDSVTFEKQSKWKKGKTSKLPGTGQRIAARKQRVTASKERG